MLKSQDIDKLEKAIEALKKTLPAGDCKQPPIMSFETTEAIYLVHLKNEFKKHDPVLFKEAEKIAKELGFRFKQGPNKKDDRSIEKAKLSYELDFSELKDLCRASILCITIADIVKLQEVLAARLTLVRVKNRFARKFDATKESAGYRDLQFTVQVPGTKLLWELQVHLVDIEDFKSKNRDVSDINGRTGHQRYVAFRTIRERLQVVS